MASESLPRTETEPTSRRVHLLHAPRFPRQALLVLAVAVLLGPLTVLPSTALSDVHALPRAVVSPSSPPTAASGGPLYTEPSYDPLHLRVPVSYASSADPPIPAPLRGAPELPVHTLPPSPHAYPAPSSAQGPSVLAPVGRPSSAGPSGGPRPMINNLSYGRIGWVGEISSTDPCACSPPDVQVAVGPGFVIEMVNSYVNETNKTGAHVNSYPTTQLFGTGASDLLIDGMIIYDNNTTRYWASAWDASTYHLLLAVSGSNDPDVSGWSSYSIASSAVLADQPKLGLDRGVVTLSANDFNSTTYADLGREIWIFPLGSILQGSLGSWYYYPAMAGVHSVVPADTRGWSPALYYVSLNLGGGSTASLYTLVWNGGSSIPQMTTKVLGINATTLPPNVPLIGTTNTLATNDGRVLSAVWNRGDLWFSANDGCVPSGDTSTRSCGLVAEINTSNAATAVTQQILIAYVGWDVYYPAVAMDQFNDVGWVFGTSSVSSAVYPSAAMGGQSLHAANGTWDYPGVYLYNGKTSARGSSNPTICSTTCRYGDYFGIASDPDAFGQAEFYAAGEYVTTGLAWSTLISAFQISPYQLVGNLTAPSSLDVGQVGTFVERATNGLCLVSEPGFCSFYLPFGDGASASGCVSIANNFSVTHAYTAPGTYRVGAGAYIAMYDQVYTPGYGCNYAPNFYGEVNLSSTSLTVIAAPTISVPTAAPASATVDIGQPVTFSSTTAAGAGGNTYLWSGLPTGCTGGSTLTVTCTPTASGLFMVSVAVTDSNGFTVTSGTRYFTVLPDPTTTPPTGTPTSGSLDAGQTVTLSTTPSGGNSTYYSYAWSGLPTGCTTANIPNLSCTPTAGGTFSILVKVTDANGFTVTSSPLSYTVDGAPLVTPPTASRWSVDAGQAVTFTVSGSGGSGSGYTYSWKGLPVGCASSNTATLTCTPTGAGTYSVQALVTDSNGGTGSSTTLSYHVFAALVAGTPVASPTGGSLGQTETFTTAATGGSGGLVYSWVGLPGGCTSSNSSTLTCSPSATGTFSVAVHVVDSNGASTTSAALSFTVSTPLSVTLSSSSSSVASGSSVTLTGAVTGGAGPFTYVWSGLPSGCAGADQPTLSCTPTRTGTFTVTLQVTDSLGRVSSAQTTIQVTSGGSGSLTGLLSNPFLLIAMVVVVAALLLLIVLLRRRRRSGGVAPAASSPPSAPAPAAPAAAAPPPPTAPPSQAPPPVAPQPPPPAPAQPSPPSLPGGGGLPPPAPPDLSPPPLPPPP